MNKRLCLMLGFSLSAVAQANTGQCVGKVLDAASYITASGMQLAVVADTCTGSYTDHCEGQVVSFSATFSKSADIMQQAVSICGGDGSPCGLTVTRVYEEFTNLVSAVDGLRAAHGVTSKNMQVLADEFMLATTAITNAAKTCDEDPASVNAKAGYCVGKAMDSATQIAAAGIAFDKTRKTCTGVISDRCSFDQGFVMNAISKATERAVEASRDCASEGLLQCGIDISTTSGSLAEATQYSLQTKVNMKDGALTSGGLANLDSVGEALGVASQSIGKATTSCKDGGAPSANEGQCAADSITATSYVATASMGIAVAAKDCAHGESDDVGMAARCVTDVAYTIQNYAKTANEIIWATGACGNAALANNACAINVGKAIQSIAAAVAATAHIAKFVIAANWGSAQAEFQSLGDSLDAVGSTIGAAVATCVPEPPAEPVGSAPVPKVIQGVPVSGGHPATASAEVAGTGLWGLEAKKWFNMQGKQEAAQSIFGKYMVPAAAGAVGLVLLSIVTVAARLTSKRSRASLQTIADREGAELMEEIGE